MKSILKTLAVMATGAIIGGLTVHCLHLQAENDTLTDALLDDDFDCDDEACPGCCAECMGYDEVESCTECPFSDVCPARDGFDGRESCEGGAESSDEDKSADEKCASCESCDSCSDAAIEGK